MTMNYSLVSSPDNLFKNENSVGASELCHQLSLPCLSVCRILKVCSFAPTMFVSLEQQKIQIRASTADNQNMVVVIISLPN